MDLSGVMVKLSLYIGRLRIYGKSISIYTGSLFDLVVFEKYFLHGWLIMLIYIYLLFIHRSFFS